MAGGHARAREATAADDCVPAFDSDARPVPIFAVQCGEALAGPDVADFAGSGLVASVAWPVPMEALQWTKLGTPLAVDSVAVELLEARPVPIAALQ